METSVTSRKKTSPIWDYFTIGEDNKFAKCSSCELLVSRGGKTAKTFGTTNLSVHLKGKHPELYTEFEKKIKDLKDAKEAREKPRPSRQLSLMECKDQVRHWDINDVRAQRVHRRIGEMIALDCHPFSVVEDEGFIRLVKELEPRYTLPSRRYFTENVVTKIYENLRQKVSQAVSDVEYFSFTTDVWSTCVSNESLLSLTAHWISDTFQRTNVMLNASRIDGSHTGAYIAQKIKEILESWFISTYLVHVILRDNGSNMVRAMKDASLPDLGCFAHTLQLVVHDGVLSQRAVIDILAICRKVVGHFKHSSLAYSRLREIQKNLSLPQHRLKQDEPTRWNSTLYMLQSITEQKMALAAYSSEYDIAQLSSYQLDLVNKIISTLTPIEEITKSISTNAASVSAIIPFIRMLEKSLEKHHDDRGVQTMKQEMLKSLKQRYACAESNEILTISTALDPRFKDKCFRQLDTVEEVKSRLKDKVTELKSSETEQPPSVASTEGREEPTSKRQKTTLLQCFSEILQETGALVDDSGNEVDIYLSEPLIEFHGGEHSLNWWATNKLRFPILAKLARRYLSAPPTSVPSERLFSVAGDLYDEKRNRLSPEHAEELRFIKSNFHLL